MKGKESVYDAAKHKHINEMCSCRQRTINRCMHQCQDILDKYKKNLMIHQSIKKDFSEIYLMSKSNINKKPPKEEESS